MVDHSLGWCRARRAYAAGNSVTGNRPLSTYASSRLTAQPSLDSSSCAMARAADRWPPPTREYTSSTRRPERVSTLDVRPTSRCWPTSQSAELRVTDWSGGAAAEMHGLLDAFDRAPRPS